MRGSLIQPTSGIAGVRQCKRAKWLSPPHRIDGWRIDVANMTGRLGEIDLNESVRKAIRRTMIEIEPETLLVAESTNDAASDLQGDAWHGAMTYAAFTPAFAVWSLPGVATPATIARKPAALPQAGGIADAEIAALEGEE